MYWRVPSVSEIIFYILYWYVRLKFLNYAQIVHNAVPRHAVMSFFPLSSTSWIVLVYNGFRNEVWHVMLQHKIIFWRWTCSLMRNGLKKMSRILPKNTYSVTSSSSCTSYKPTHHQWKKKNTNWLFNILSSSGLLSVDFLWYGQSILFSVRDYFNDPVWWELRKWIGILLPLL